MAALITSNHTLLEQAHMDRIASAWSRRALTVCSPRRDWASLAQSDARLHQGFELLLCLHQDDADLSSKRLQDVLIPGELWALAVLAMRRQHAPTWQACVALAQALPRQQQALLDAAHWVDAAAVQWALSNWPSASNTAAGDAESAQAPHLRTVFALHAAQQHSAVLHDLKQDHAWSRLCGDPKQPTALIKAVLELAGFTPLPEVTELTHAFFGQPMAEDQAGSKWRFLCAQAQLLAHKSHRTSAPYRQARQVLSALAQCGQHPSLAWPASQALVCADPAHFRTVLAAQARVPQLRETYIKGLGWGGAPAAMEPLMAALREPPLAQLAAASISLITGSYPELDDWEDPSMQRPLPPDEVGVIREPDPVREYPQPDAQAFARWWQAHRSQFQQNVIRLEGGALSRAHLGLVLQSGRLQAREVAARKLQWLLVSGRRLDTRWPAHVQRQWLQQHLTAETETIGSAS